MDIMYSHVINCDIITQSPVSGSCPLLLHIKYQKGLNQLLGANSMVHMHVEIFFFM